MGQKDSLVIYFSYGLKIRKMVRGNRVEVQKEYQDKDYLEENASYPCMDI
jgi:hypothetical protein